MAHEQLRLHYQPILDVRGGLHAVEGLLRWQHPDEDLLEASEFLDAAVRSGAIVSIVSIGQWVVEQACAQMRRWRRDLGAAGPACTYVRLSRSEVVDAGVSDAITCALLANDLEPPDLGVQLLSHGFLDAQALSVLQRWQQRGHPLVVDDPGTGCSLLSRLVDLPVGAVKIDRRLLAGIGRDARRQALVGAVVDVAGSLDVHVIADGVEDGDQAELVRRAGCRYLQGTFCGPAQTAEDLTASWSRQAG